MSQVKPDSIVGNASETDSFNDSRTIIEPPKTGDVLRWSGSSTYHPDSIRRVLGADWGGILHPKRPMLSLLDLKTGAVSGEYDSLVLGKPFVFSWHRFPVFLAKVQRAEPAGTEQGGDTDHTIVVKLAYFDARERGENINMDDFNFIKAKEIVKFVKAEADAYAALEKAQGSIVPYSYGFYEATMHPACTQTWGLIKGTICSSRLPMATSALAKYLSISPDRDQRRYARHFCCNMMFQVSVHSYVPETRRWRFHALTSFMRFSTARKSLSHPDRTTQGWCIA